MAMLVLCVWIILSPAEAQETIPVARAGQAPPSAGANVTLTPEERQWLTQHDGQIRIGITVIPPQVLRRDGDYEGLSLDYIHLIERKLGCRFALVPYATWNEVMQAAKARQIDMIFAAQQTPERLQYLRFTRPYIELPNVILVRQDREGEHTLPDMTGWSVAVSEGSAVHEHLKREHGNLNLRPVPDELTGLRQLSLGEVDAMVVEISRASYYIEKQGILNLRVAGNAGLLYQLRFAVRNDWPILCGILDAGLGAIQESERREINQRWVNVGGTGLLSNRTFRLLLVSALGLVLLAGTVVFAWVRTLRWLVRQRTAELRRELTERRRAEAALHESEAKYRIVADNTYDWEFWQNPKGRFVYISPSCKRITGHEAEEFIADASLFRQIIHPDDQNRYDRHLDDSLQKRQPSAMEYRLIRADGTVVWIDHLCQAVFDSSGSYLGRRGSNRDITARKQAEEALRKLNEELEARVKSRTAELEKKNKELEQMLKAFVGRELRMAELKQRIGELEKQPSGTGPARNT
jgi:PAS domain S-box-containing protein